jgi:hypothetical protein
VQKHHEQISWTMKSTRCYMYGDGLRLMALGLGLGQAFGAVGEERLGTLLIHEFVSKSRFR